VNKAATLAKLPEQKCATRELRIHGYDPQSSRFETLSIYGSDAAEVQKLMVDDPTLATPLHPSLPYVGAEVVWAVRAEMARTVTDVLARRLRALFLNAKVAIEMAPRVAELMAQELGQTIDWKERQVRDFVQLAKAYCV
jgi:glycerol-3-phosphate dehydrogenase